MPYIYKITNKINNKIYIGKTIRTITERWKEHCRDYIDRNYEQRPLYSAMRKYGLENFVIEELEECDLEKLEEREKYWIEYYQSFKYGYNATLGGDGKPYIDRSLIINLYKQYGTCAEVSKITGHDAYHISKILKEQQIEVRPSSIINYERYGKNVLMNDLNNQPIKTFKSLYEAARYIKNITNSDSLEKHIAANISRAARGKRKTAYKFIWSFIEK